MSVQVLSDVCEIVQGGRRKLSGNHFVEDGYPAYGAGGLNGRLPEFEYDRPGVILSSIGARCGKCFYVDGKWISLANTQLILPDPKRVDAKFLWYQLNDEGRWPRSGSAQPFIKPSDVKKHAVFLPSLDEQRRIAAILDQADALRRKQQEALRQIDRLTSAIFDGMFGDPKTDPPRWPTLDFEEACRDETSRSEKLQRGEYLAAGLYPVIDQGQSVIAGWTNDRILLCQSNLPVILFGDHTRAVKFIDFEFVIGADGAKVLNPSNKYDPLFFAYLLRRLPLPDLGYSRHMREVKRLSFPHPPLELQQRFSMRIAEADELRAAHLSRLSRLDALFACLQHRAFRGEL